MSGATGVRKVVVYSDSRDDLTEVERQTFLSFQKGIGSIVVRRIESIGKHVIEEAWQHASDSFVFFDKPLEELRIILAGLGITKSEDCPPIHIAAYWSTRKEPVAIKRIGGGLEKPVTVWVHSGYLLASALQAR